MKWHLAVAVIAVLCIGLFCTFPTQNIQAQAKGKASLVEQKITVLSPMGTPPPIQLKPRPPRLDTLEGKTIYIVDQGYLGTDNLLKEMIVWFEREFPKTTFVFKRLDRTMGGQTPPLYAEIKEKADAMVMGLGH
jgi:hypothetical protein